MKKKYCFMIFLMVIIFFNTAIAYSLTGDVDTNGSIDIIDALLTAQYYVGLDPQNYDPVAGDTDCNGTVDIIDALLIAQYYVGLITGFSGCSSEPTPSPVPSADSVADATYPTEMFSYRFAWANGFTSWTIESLPSYLSAPRRTSGAYEELVTFKIDWSQIPEGGILRGVAIFSIQGEPTGRSEIILGVDLHRSDPQATPTPVVDGTPVPTIPAMVVFQGYVYDSNTYEPISGATITFDGDTGIATGTSEDNGYYQVGIGVGWWIDGNLSISIPNYTPQVYTFNDILGTFWHDFPLENVTTGSLSPLFNSEKVNTITFSVPVSDVRRRFL